MMDLSYIPSYFIDGAALYNGASSGGGGGRRTGRRDSA